MGRTFWAGPDGIIVNYETGSEQRPSNSREKQTSPTGIPTPEERGTAQSRSVLNQVCQYCGKDVPVDKLADHCFGKHKLVLEPSVVPLQYRHTVLAVQRVAWDGRASPSRKGTWAGARERVACHICKALVRADRWLHHQKKHSTNNSRRRMPPPKPGVPDRVPPAPGMWECDYCGQAVKDVNMRHHVREVHSGIPGTQARRRSRRRVKGKAGVLRPDSPVFPVGLEPTRKPPEDTRYGGPLDGSWGFGKYRREFNGRWGSYPSFDDYSEEAFE